MEQCAEFSEADKAKLFKNSRLYLIGRIESFANSDVDPDLRDIVYSLNPMSFEKLASADWLFHSNQDDLQEIICWLSELKDTMIILFHNDLQNLNDFIAENQFDTDKVKCFDNSKIDL